MCLGDWNFVLVLYHLCLEVSCAVLECAFLEYVRFIVFLEFVRFIVCLSIGFQNLEIKFEF